MNSSKQRFPAWIRRAWPSGPAHEEVRSLLGGLNLHTVCQSAHCPNQGECWARRTATFLIMGNVCTRHCAFCGVHSGAPLPVDPDEPEKVAEAVARLGVRHTVITSVTRDDLPDGGAAHFARVIRAIRTRTPEVTLEVLTPDFGADPEALALVAEAAPEIYSHNIETVRRLHPALRDARYRYGTSLETLRVARRLMPGAVVKSGFMLGCGETEAEALETLADLRAAGCDAVAVGQYLRPRTENAPVAEFAPPECFDRLRAAALDLGFAFAVAGPFVRSSYHSEDALRARPSGRA